MEQNERAAAFEVPCAVADHYLKLADGAKIKILLYILRNNIEKPDTRDLADYFDIEEEKVREALDFWEKADILPKNRSVKVRLGGGNIARKRPEMPAQKQESGRGYDVNEYREVSMASDRIKNVIRTIEMMQKRQLYKNEMEKIRTVCMKTALEATTIVTLVSYCMEKGSSDIDTICEKMIVWDSKGIRTLEQAEQLIRTEEQNEGFYREVSALLEVPYPLEDEQRAYADLWKENAYDIQTIKRAYEIMISKINRVNFKYMNTIMENWRKNGVKKPPENNSVKKYSELINKF